MNGIGAYGRGRATVRVWIWEESIGFGMFHLRSSGWDHALGVFAALAGVSHAETLVRTRGHVYLVSDFLRDVLGRLLLSSVPRPQEDPP